MVGMAYVNIRILRNLKEELVWAKAKQFQLISNRTSFKSHTTKNLKKRPF